MSHTVYGYIYNKPTVQSLIFALIHLHTLSEIKKCLNSQHVFVEDLTSGQTPSSPQSSLPECRVLSQSTTDKLTDTTVD